MTNEQWKRRQESREKEFMKREEIKIKETQRHIDEYNGIVEIDEFDLFCMGQEAWED